MQQKLPDPSAAGKRLANGQQLYCRSGSGGGSGDSCLKGFGGAVGAGEGPTYSAVRDEGEPATDAVLRHYERKCVGRVYFARVERHNGPMTVALYQGDDAEQVRNFHYRATRKLTALDVEDLLKYRSLIQVNAVLGTPTSSKFLLLQVRLEFMPSYFTMTRTGQDGVFRSHPVAVALEPPELRAHIASGSGILGFGGPGGVREGPKFHVDNIVVETLHQHLAPQRNLLPAVLLRFVPVQLATTLVDRISRRIVLARLTWVSLGVPDYSDRCLIIRCEKSRELDDFSPPPLQKKYSNLGLLARILPC
ncbi:hypothetical protein C8R45DRAFT_937559 [Mycena sanguinolenta]|nr:hypothetical protein C8R45DRAFT_937559 [Mycena sanguinolenta]